MATHPSAFSLASALFAFARAGTGRQLLLSIYVGWDVDSVVRRIGLAACDRAGLARSADKSFAKVVFFLAHDWALFLAGERDLARPYGKARRL